MFSYFFKDSYSANYKQVNTSLADVVAMVKKNQLDQLKADKLAQLTDEMKDRFSDIKTEQAIILHDNLEFHERYIDYQPVQSQPGT